jgi:hypothetical protein
MKDLPWILCTVIGAGVLGLQCWLFYFADCATVKDYWMLTHVPGRCL